MDEQSGERNPLELLAEEFLARDRRGERPSVSEYVARYPALAAQINELFPVLLEMERARPEAAQPSPARMLGRDSPRRLGEYRILREIGRGGMAVVFEAEQESLGRRVALKVLARASISSQQVLRFEREARSAAKLHHTNIVPVFGVGFEGDVHYYVMQYIPGQPLDVVLKEVRSLRGRDHSSPQKGCALYRAGMAEAPLAAELARSLCSGRFAATALAGAADHDPAAVTTVADSHHASDEPAPEGAAEAMPSPANKSDIFSASVDLSGSGRRYACAVARIGVQVAEALDYAAEQGIIHRDVKPSNILLDLHGTAWVTDFGLAKAAGQEDLTHTGDLVGTLRYMAPERFRGESDRRSDVYALGLTLYELLALRPAYDESDRAGLIRQVTEMEPPRLTRLDTSIPRDLATIVHKATAREPADRYQTAGALASDLRRFLDDRPILARRPSLLDRAAKWSRRYRAAVAAGAVGIVVAMAILAASIGWIWRDRAARAELMDREINQALVEAAALHGREKWPQALEVVKRASGFLAMSQNAPLRRRVDQMRQDLEMILQLEAIRLPRPIKGIEGAYEGQSWDAAYAGAFRGYGIDVETLEPARAGALIKARTIRRELTAALDHWADQRLRHRPAGDRGHARLFAVARAADPDEWRNKIRDAMEQRDTATANELVAAAPIDKLPRETLELLVILANKKNQLSVLRRTQRRYPDDYWINFKLAYALDFADPPLQDQVEAIRFYTAAVAVRPGNAPGHYYLAHVLDQTGRLDEAIIEYRKSIELDPDFVWPSAGLRAAYLKQGKLDLAIRESRRVINRNPNEAQAHATLSHALALEGEIEESIREFDITIRLKPELAGVENNLAWIFLTNPKPHLRDPRRGLELAQRAVKRSPERGSVWNTLGVARYRNGDWEGATAALEKSIALRGYTSFDGFFLAMAHARLGHREEARRHYDKADRWMQKAKPTDRELRLFRAEAVELLQIKERPSTGAALPAG